MSGTGANVGVGWDKTGSLEQVLEVFKSFDPVLLRLFRKVDPKGLKVWQLLDMEKPPAWVNERMALLGDAAHPFTPCM
jgi:2-polyprenyl-6-methoxyphenol hydroxylase-like FAD-dependent oxidoreductase